MTPATTLADAIDAFEVQELVPGTDRWSYYVEARQTYLGEAPSTLASMLRALERSARLEGEKSSPKAMLSGHKGTGKSTELQRISDKLGDRFEVVHCKLARKMNGSDVNARDVLFLIAAALVERLAEHKALSRLDSDAETRAALTSLHRRLPKLGLGEVNLSFFGAVSSSINVDWNVRSAIRQIAEEQPKDLMALLAGPLRALRAIVERPVLIIADDLGNLDPRISGRDLIFSQDLPLLMNIPAAMILTVPMDILFNPDFPAIHNHKLKGIVSHIKLWTDRGRVTRFEPGWELMREVARRRISLDLVEPEALDAAIGLSGGSLDQFRLLMRQAADNADYLARGKVGAEHIAQAARMIRAEHVRVFGADRHIRDLHRVHEEKTIQSPDDLIYLPMLTVIEHENENPWFDTNPIIEPYVAERWQEVVARDAR